MLQHDRMPAGHHEIAGMSVGSVETKPLDASEEPARRGVVRHAPLDLVQDPQGTIAGHGERERHQRHRRVPTFGDDPQLVWLRPEPDQGDASPSGRAVREVRSQDERREPRAAHPRPERRRRRSGRRSGSAGGAGCEQREHRGDPPSLHATTTREAAGAVGQRGQQSAVHPRLRAAVYAESLIQLSSNRLVP